MLYQSPVTVAVAASSSGDNTVVAAVTSRKIRVLGWIVTANAAVNFKFRSAANDKTGLHYCGAAGHRDVAPITCNPDLPWFETNAGEALVINLSGAVAVGGELVYIVV